MREILFRGKPKRKDDFTFFKANFSNDCLTDGFVQGSLLIDKNSGRYYIAVTVLSKLNCCVNNTMLSAIEIDPSTVGQYTGFTDKNGKKIFEGDILRSDIYPYHSRGFDNYYAEISWFGDTACFGIVTHKNPKSAVNGISDGNTDYIEEYDLSDFEVIGNIHDNPELVEGACSQE